MPPVGPEPQAASSAAPTWPPAEACRGLIKRLIERADALRLRWEAPLVVVYLVDTLRADHTTPYGYARDTTPFLNQFAKDAVVFETAVTHASWTKPSVASIFTSQLPGRHRAVQLRIEANPGAGYRPRNPTEGRMPTAQ